MSTSHNDQSYELEPRENLFPTDTEQRYLSDYSPEQKREAFSRLGPKIKTVDFDAPGYIPFADNAELENKGVAVPFDSVLKLTSSTNREEYAEKSNKLNAQRRLLYSLTAYLKLEAALKRPFLTSVGQIDSYVYDNKAGYLLADDNPLVGEGYQASAFMLSDLSKWAMVCLSKTEYERWHNGAVENIKPDSWRPPHIDRFGDMTRL